MYNPARRSNYNFHTKELIERSLLKIVVVQRLFYLWRMQFRKNLFKLKDEGRSLVVVEKTDKVCSVAALVVLLSVILKWLKVHTNFTHKVSKNRLNMEPMC